MINTHGLGLHGFMVELTPCPKITDYTRTLQDRLLSVAGVIGLQVKICVKDSQPKEPGSPQFHQILGDLVAYSMHLSLLNIV